MWLALQALAGLAMLVVGAELLVRGASSLALRLGISPLAVGLTVVSFGTSAPELVVSLQAARAGAGDIAVGNVVGSNVCNVALILGLAALVKPATVNAKIFRLDAPLMVVVSVALMAALAGGGVSRLEGSLFLSGLVAYTVATLWMARREPPEVQTEYADGARPAPRGVAASALAVVGGLAVLVWGADLLVESAVSLAGALGVSEAVIGLTVVAVGTSLPELATSVVAAARGQGDIAVGNVVGSNLFNILGIVGFTAVLRPLAPGGIGWVDLGVMVAMAVVLLPIARTGFVVSRHEGVVLVLAYVGYLAWLVAGAS